jgi:hypothetical protein
MTLIKWVLVQMIGFISSWVTHSVIITLTYRSYSSITVLHTFQFTVVHALGFSLPTSRLLATDLNTETITSNHWSTHSKHYTQTNSSTHTIKSSPTMKLPRLSPAENFQRTDFSLFYKPLIWHAENTVLCTVACSGYVMLQRSYDPSLLLHDPSVYSVT